MTDSLPDWISVKGDKIQLQVYTQPKAAHSQIEGPYGTPARLKIRIAAPPVDGAANEELVRFLSKSLGISKAQLEIKFGHTGKHKTIEVRGIQVEGLSEKLKACFKKS